jgi:hypothetical protein
MEVLHLPGPLLPSRQYLGYNVRYQSQETFILVETTEANTSKIETK